MNSWNIFLSVLFGAIGMGYFIYGRKQYHGVALAVGVLLCIFPYFVPQIWLMILVGIGLMALPRFLNF